MLVGVGALQTLEAVELAKDALEVGAAAGLLAPVSYAPLQDEEVFQHFQAVAAVGLPLCIYNNPGTTHFTFSPALVGRLSEIPGVVAVKNPAPVASECDAAVATLRKAVRRGFSVGFAVDMNAGAALLAGADAWYSVLGGIYPVTCLQLTRAAQAGNANEVARIDDLLQPVWDLFKAYTSFRVVHLAREPRRHSQRPASTPRPPAVGPGSGRRDACSRRTGARLNDTEVKQQVTVLAYALERAFLADGGRSALTRMKQRSRHF